MSGPYQYVSLVANGGTPVQLVDQRGAPFPTTGEGALVFGTAPTLVNPNIISPVFVGSQTIVGDLTVTGYVYATTPPVSDDTTKLATTEWVNDAISGAALVFSLSGGTTGLTPNTPTTGAIVLGGTLIAANGGTGFASYAVGDLLYANTTTTLAKLPDVGVGNALLSGGVGVAPLWGKIALTTHVSGILPVANGGTGVTSSTGTVNVVLSNGPTLNSPTLITPALGTPTALTLTNATGLPLATGVTGTLGATNGGTGQTTYATGDLLYASALNTLSKLAAGTNGYVLTMAGGVPTWAASTGGVNSWSAGTTGLTPNSPTTGAVVLAGTLAVANGGTGITSFGTGVATALGINVGSAGAFVTFNGALGTPSSGTLTNATGLPISTGVSGLGANVATWLGTPSSANLAAAVTDETGTGALVFAGSPTLTGTALANNITASGVVTGASVTASNGIFVNALTVAADYTIAVGYSAVSAGPVTIAAGKSVTVSAGSRWVVL